MTWLANVRPDNPDKWVTVSSERRGEENRLTSRIHRDTHKKLKARGRGVAPVIRDAIQLALDVRGLTHSREEYDRAVRGMALKENKPTKVFLEEWVSFYLKITDVPEGGN